MLICSLVSLLFSIEKLAEAQRRFATLQNELQSTLDAQKETSGIPTLRQRRKPVFHLSHEERVQHRNIKDLKLAFSEFYLSLILLQNYQVTTILFKSLLHFIHALMKYLLVFLLKHGFQNLVMGDIPLISFLLRLTSLHSSF